MKCSTWKLPMIIGIVVFIFLLSSAGELSLNIYKRYLLNNEQSEIVALRRRIHDMNHMYENKTKEFKEDKFSHAYSVDLVMSFADFGLRPPRTGYRSLLMYWPSQWGILFILDNENQTQNFPYHFIQCFINNTNPSPTIRVSRDGQFKHMNDIKFFVNHWKFYLDQESNSDIIAFFDDDACLFYPYNPSLIVDEYNRLFAYGARFKWTRYQKYIVDVMHWEYIGDFMVDFPVFVWREMLVELRLYLTQHFAKDDPPTFADALDRLLRYETNAGESKFGEFSIIFHYAWNTPKWRKRYAWNLYTTYNVNQNESFLLARGMHDTETYCPIDISLGENYIGLWLFPYTLSWEPKEDGSMVHRTDRSWYDPSFTQVVKTEAYRNWVTRMKIGIRQGKDLYKIETWNEKYPHVLQEWDRCWDNDLMCRQQKDPSRCY
jgi:hypothetical protein